MKYTTKMYLKSLYDIAKPIGKLTCDVTKCAYEGIKAGVNDAIEEAREQGVFDDMRKDTQEIKDNIKRIKDNF